MEPIVFIHGIFQMLADLPAPRLFAPRSVLISDMLGYRTRAKAPVETIFLQAQADDLVEQIRARGHARVHIVGHSLGGAVAMPLARRHPELVASVVTVEGNFTLGDAVWTGKIAAMTLAEVITLLQSYQMTQASG
jgi:lipase